MSLIILEPKVIISQIAKKRFCNETQHWTFRRMSLHAKDKLY